MRKLLLLLGVYLASGLLYAWAIPPFEGPDEWSHITLVRYTAAHKALPPWVMPGEDAGEMASFLEFKDPPLYYAPPLYYLLAATTPWAQMQDLPDLLVPSPSWERGWAPEPDGSPLNKNLYSHRAEENWRQSETVRAVYLVRVFSLLLGAGTIVGTYISCRLLWPRRPTLALGAAAVIALNPKFISVSACVTNDNLLNALASASFAWGIFCSVRETTAYKHWAILGILVGLALLTKQSALLLLPWGLLVAFLQDDGTVWSRKVGHAGAVLAAVLCVAGWWYVRNARLYGDPLGLATHLAVGSPRKLGWEELIATGRSYWAAFGWGPILLEPWLYAVPLLTGLGAAAGVVAAGLPGRSWWSLPATTRRCMLLLGLVFGLNLVTLARWVIATGAPTGRLLFPTLPAVAILAAWGLSQWTRYRAARRGLTLVAAVMAILTVSIVPLYLRPAYASPLLRDGVPRSAVLVDHAFEDGIHLAGYEATSEDLAPGKQIELTLYWSMEHDLEDENARLWVQLSPVDATRKVAEYNWWLGRTIYPTSLWRPKDTIRETIALQIPPESVPAPALYWFRVGLAREDGRLLDLADGSQMVSLGPWRMLAGRPPPPPPCPSGGTIGSISILGYGLQRVSAADQTRVHIDLYWQAAGDPVAVDYTAFVHLDSAGDLVAQDDSPPVDGRYPTSWWLPRQVIVDHHVISMTAPISNDVQLWIGMYDPETMIRAPARDSAGHRQDGDRLLLSALGSPDPACDLSAIGAAGD